jgi:hypothetical protein
MGSDEAVRNRCGRQALVAGTQNVPTAVGGDVQIGRIALPESEGTAQTLSSNARTANVETVRHA